jgi:Family of unknown function (DUF6263)
MNMKSWRWAGALVLVGAAALGVTANDNQGGDKPTWKAFDELNKSFWQEMKTDTTQTMKVQGMEVVQKQSQTFYVQWTPKSKDKDCWKVEYKIVGVKMDIQIGGNKIDYDSTSKDQVPQNPLTDFFKALVGSTFNFTVCSDPKEGIRVTDVEGLQGFVQKLAAANEQLKPLLESILNKEALKQMSNPTFAAFPRTDEEFKKGEWNYDVTLNMGPIGNYNTHYTYKINSKDKNKIDVSGTMDYSPPKSDALSGLPFQIKKGDLKAEKITGTITLDPKGGRIADSTMQMDLSGTLDIDIAGMVTTVNLTQKQSSTVKTLDTDPVPPASAPPKKGL